MPFISTWNFSLAFKIELIKIMNSRDSYGLVYDLKDKFGDHGIISFLILKKTSTNEVFIENWAMSCRVLERGMENFIINYLLDFCKSHHILQEHAQSEMVYIHHLAIFLLILNSQLP